MSRPKVIVALALAVYLAALAVAWRVVTGFAYDQTVKLLVQSEAVFIESVGDYIDSILLHAASLVLRDLGEDARSVPVERMQRLAERYQVDEINLVGTNGVCHSSTDARIVGYDFSEVPETAEYLGLLRGALYVAQPFRCSKADPGDYRKYLGLPIDGGRGFIQIGVDFSRACRSMLFFDRDGLRNWRIGCTGFYDRYDGDGDGVCDYPLQSDVPGEVSVVRIPEGRCFVRPFTYGGGRFLSLLPEGECFGERNLNFAIMAPTLAGIVVFFVWFVLSMARSSERERRRREDEDRTRARDLALARAIQLSALPSFEHLRRNFFTFSLSAKTNPAKEVGGDFYDIRFVGENRLALVMADVSGKGVPAAMFMMEAKNEIASALGTEQDLATAVRDANRRLCANNDAEMFVTAWIGVVDIPSGAVEYVNAGHDRPFVRRTDGAVEKIPGKGGPFLGMFPEAKYRSDSFTLGPGEVFFLFTDGITEAMNRSRELYGEARLIETLGGDCTVPERVIERVDESVRRFADGAERSDDLTSLAFVRHGGDGRRERTFAADRASLGPAMEWLRGAVALTDRSAVARLLNAADEVMVNIIDYSGSPGFTISVENAPGRTRLAFTDSGKAYDPLAHSDPDTHLPLAERPEGGLGILMLKHLVDAVFYRRENGCNRLFLAVFRKTTENSRDTSQINRTTPHL